MTRRTRPFRWSIPLAVLILVLTGALDGVLLKTLGKDAPENDDFQDVAVALGETSEIAGVRLRVDRLESAYALHKTSGVVDRPTRSTGIFLVFTVTAEGYAIDNLHSINGDVSYAGLTAEATGQVQPKPGTAETARLHAELDPQRLQGAKLRLWQYENTFRYRRRLVVDLGIDAQRAAELTGVPRDKAYTLPRPEIRGLE
ncbi:hypothetical protein HJ590_11215 [Naumannella sp. ID2617S]|uniref:Uncharacterized protein n=1 Tax=Enemella dayhoffiae TaxID=2016507 RepID=A0A255HE20_9ACTN|nr:hypothetical protein [Enemella dayhoffiae]NNG20132.1 hypothetical protein [Naumannella sp. ID2617S]OYO25333.1 hypothetical protein CGZ93_02520 [Enemella dayhoffiae]